MVVDEMKATAHRFPAGLAALEEVAHDSTPFHPVRQTLRESMREVRAQFADRGKLARAVHFAIPSRGFEARI